MNAMPKPICCLTHHVAVALENRRHLHGIIRGKKSKADSFHTGFSWLPTFGVSSRFPLALEPSIRLRVAKTAIFRRSRTGRRGPQSLIRSSSLQHTGCIGTDSPELTSTGVVDSSVVEELAKQDDILENVVDADDLLQRLLVRQDSADHVARVTRYPEDVDAAPVNGLKRLTRRGGRRWRGPRTVSCDSSRRAAGKVVPAKATTRRFRQ